MSENNPVRLQGGEDGAHRPPTPGKVLPEQAFEGVWTWQKFRRFAARAVAVLGAMLLFGATLFGFSGWYTSRSEFCNSCHIMEPYYTSWQHSSHKDVSCVKCHFPPGAGEKLRGKMMGLVQLIKYVTESQGPRPTAEISDASCLRSGCHDTRLLSGKLEFQGMPFDHRPHLEETKRGKQLRCTSCHSQIVQGSHMTVTTSTCFLCHFKDQHFNEGLGTCTRCHQIPDKSFDLGGGVTFSHNLAYERGVDCANCHGDLIRGNGEVPRERCSVCHNREDDFKRIGDHVYMHQVHVTDHKVDCLSCHLTIQHSADPQRIAHAASNCAGCHPNQHQEQVALIEGIGARAVPQQLSTMTAARISCPTCHQQKEVSATGTMVWKASLHSCLTCHEPEAAQRLESYHAILKAALAEVEATLKNVGEAAKTAELPADRTAAIAVQLENLQHDVSFLRAGNGVHNIHYADTLTRALVDQLGALCRELQVDAPTITLPETAKPGADKTEAGKEEKAEPQPTEPEAAKPEPETPEVTESAGEDKPEAMEPEAEKPEAAEPSEPGDEAQPEVMDAETEKPEPTEPAKPDPTQPEPAKPEPGGAEPTKPEPAEPPSAEPKPADSES
jgi:nitrate/TMAO reductase-like tetraheme cytochrome c subunit